jgi:hypothetical protein
MRLFRDAGEIRFRWNLKVISGYSLKTHPPWVRGRKQCFSLSSSGFDLFAEHCLGKFSSFVPEVRFRPGVSYPTKMDPFAHDETCLVSACVLSTFGNRG